MCNRQACFEFTLNTMNNGYVRLLEAARELKAWDTPAEVARGLLPVAFLRQIRRYVTGESAAYLLLAFLTPAK